MKRKIKLYKHRIQYKLDNTEPAVVGFWVCMSGVLVSQVMLFVLR